MRSGFFRSLVFGCVAACLGVAGACMRFTPFQVDLTEDQKHHTEANLRKLAASPGQKGERFSFGLLADSHDGYTEASDILDDLDDHEDVRFIVHAGDLTDFGSQQEFIWFDRQTADTSLPLFVAVGNHDGLANGKKLYEEMFGPPNFTFRYASVKFVFFNTNTIEYGLAEPDLAWLEREVNDRAEDEGVIVVTHHPPDSTPHLTEAAQARYRQIHRDGRVLANLHGHIHEDYLVQRDGPTFYLRTKAALSGAYAVVSTDGRSLSWQRCVADDGCGESEVLVP